jgi:membrane protease YdiL (CAAX protease family)
MHLEAPTTCFGSVFTNSGCSFVVFVVFVFQQFCSAAPPFSSRLFKPSVHRGVKAAHRQGACDMSPYRQSTRSAYYGVVAAFPLLAAYEALLFLAATPARFQVRNAADVWLRTLLASLGASPAQATLAMMLVLLLGIPLLRRRETPLVPRYFAWIVLEAAGYSLVLFLVSAFLPPLPGAPIGQLLAPALPPPAAMPAGIGALEGIALSLGAGLFEEFAFRVVLVTALLSGTRIVFANWLSVALSIAGAAFLFSLAHYVGPFGEPFTAPSFLFRLAAGLVFTLLYYTRGFAVTAYTHALYDLWVLLV